MKTNIKKLMTPTDKLPPCDKDVYSNGQAVAIIAGGSAQLIDRFVRELAEFSEEKVDWHYVGGRAVILTTGDKAKVKWCMSQLKLNIQEYGG